MGITAKPFGKLKSRLVKVDNSIRKEQEKDKVYKKKKVSKV